MSVVVVHAQAGQRAELKEGRVAVQQPDLGASLHLSDPSGELRTLVRGGIADVDALAPAVREHFRLLPSR